MLSVTRKICEGVKLGQQMHWNTINDQKLLKGKRNTNKNNRQKLFG